MLSVAKHLGQARQILRCAQDDRASLSMTRPVLVVKFRHAIKHSPLGLLHDAVFRAPKRAGKGRRTQLLKALLALCLHIRPLASERTGEYILVQDAREALA